MDFISAIRRADWVRRRAWATWICIKDGEIVKYMSKVTREDLLAGDWIAYEYVDEPEDASSLRFMLLELE